jgi:putative ABC transport system substrate-binding protein
VKRRTFIAGLGSAAAWPVVVWAQQSEMPVVGLISPEPNANFEAAFRKGLSETGYVEGRNLSIEYRFARGNPTEFAADLVRRRVAVIAATTLNAARAAKGATETIPIVFRTGNDPVIGYLHYVVDGLA